MSTPSRIVALDVGSHSVKLGEFLVPKEGFLTLSRHRTAAIGLDPNKEENRPAAVSQVIRQLLASAGVKPQTKVAFSVAGHAVFMRNVKLPAVDAMQVEQMITFEAQQIVPFPLTEVVWDFQVLAKRENNPEKEAVIVAIKNDLLESENTAVQASGLQTEIIDVGPLALYNAYRYNYLPNDACTLLIDFGARSTNLIFIENNRFYTRFLPLAGNTISQTICNEFQEPFFVAEQLKIERGGVNLGGSYALPEDRDTARLWKIIRNVMNRVHTEINRSIIFYRNQQGGSAPVEILLTGGTSRLPHIDHFLAERFNVPVHLFNPMLNVGIGDGLDRHELSQAAVGFGEVVGLALRAAGDCPVEIKLIPPSIQASRQARRQNPIVYAALGVCFLIFVVLLGSTYHQWSIAQALQAKVVAEIEALRQLEQKQVPIEKVNQELFAKYEQAQKIFQQREAWIRLLSDLNRKAPTGMWITQLTPTYQGQSLDADVVAPVTGPSAGKAPNSKQPRPVPAAPAFFGAPEINQLDIRGLFENGLQPEVINRFVVSLVELDYFDIDPQKISDSIISTDTPQGEGQLAWNFTLRLKLKKPIDLRP